MDNREIAAALDHYAHLLERQGARTYRSRAYRKAAATIEAFPRPLAKMDDLRHVPGVGDSIAAKIGGLLDGSWQGIERLEQAAGPSEKGVALSEGAAALMAQIKGDLHAHTHATDGRDSIRAMAEAARDRGYEYIAITDHSKETRIAGGLDDGAMRRHMQRIRRTDEDVAGIRILAGAEVDILKDGRLDLPDDLLADLDVVVCSVHFRHRMSGPAQTDRILTAMAHDDADILAHPTARRRGIRPGMDIDIEAITDAAAGQGWAIEVNGAPERRDLHAEHAATAAAKGVLLSLDSDAHSVGELQNMRNACQEAAAAGLRADGILNARPLAAFQKALRS